MDKDQNATKSEDDEIDLTLLANFTHQIINPLNGVVGTLDNLIDGTIGPERREQRTAAARAQLENCITLVRNLAYLASGQSAFSSTVERKIVVPQVIIEAAMFYQEEGKRRKVSIDLENREVQNKVIGHPETLKQVLMNLFDNCIKYSRFGSQVLVRQWIQNGTSEAVITVRSFPEHEVSNEDLKSIFELGFRGSNAKQMVASGTGLGLHICNHLLKTKHNGSISVQRDGDALLFTLKLPGAWRD
ncbi:sensor histidine kinase KdpD [Ruegeria sp. Ofav3-42]|uniref:sensor histidine kinase n=1 Tax=Ruegeria sp. Ofav3-42 TaxID=2917759 RepID=UPI001EF6F5D2|nr:HAMP domain-containing sensor histidine kinase [Ruegeria sp. Ofav3-42]MCG7521510.1 HAMP domain-containing histidine kinase [Ruegeria sp. Ofav3-42]